ncbi:MAG TPA: DUF1329 domain-containing protein [Candidatus Binataceae bacterium]|nr:DUF1329 domain-containing protein [Candidatus Binataceae bacterium]
MRKVVGLLFAVLIACATLLPVAQAAESESGIAPGTIITEKNWQQYKQFMTPGLQYLWAGTYTWKLGPNVQFVVGPTQHYPEPPTYEKYTEEYASKVGIKTLPDGRHILLNYVAGLPFPKPQDPMKGWKILANDWYAYVPHIICNDASGQVFRDRMGNVTTNQFVLVLRIYDHIADPGVPIQDPAGAGLYYTEYFELTKPEQARYTAVMTIYYQDQSRNEDTFLFVPALRRTLRLSSAARCSPVFGSDATNDDTRHGAFNGNITKFDADYQGEKRILEMPNPDPIKSGFLENFVPPLYFPKPEIGKWEVRGVDVINVHRIPSLKKGYCYGSRVLYCDKESHNAMWDELYDANMKLWKVSYDPQGLVKVPGVGSYWTNAAWGNIIDMQNVHESWVYLSGPTGPMRSDSDCSNVDGLDLADAGRYGSVRGLSEIMR